MLWNEFFLDISAHHHSRLAVCRCYIWNFSVLTRRLEVIEHLHMKPNLDRAPHWPQWTHVALTLVYISLIRSFRGASEIASGRFWKIKETLSYHFFNFNHFLLGTTRHNIAYYEVRLFDRNLAWDFFVNCKMFKNLATISWSLCR